MAVSVWKTFAGIRAYVGAMGSGKTYLMTRDALRALGRGHEVWSNAGYDVRHPNGSHTRTYVALSEMLLAPKGTLLLLDEVGTFMSARNWANLPRSLMYRLTQARKDSIRLTYSAQHELQVDVALRRLTSIVYHCKRLGPLVVATGHAPHDFRRADDRSMDRMWSPIRKAVMGAYDTNARVWVPPEVLEELETETERWVPLDDELMAQLRDRVLARDDRFATTVGVALDDALTPDGDGAQNGDSTSRNAVEGADASSPPLGDYGRLRKRDQPTRQASRRSQSTNGGKSVGRTERTARADNGDEIPAFYFDD